MPSEKEEMMMDHFLDLLKEHQKLFMKQMKDKEDIDNIFDMHLEQIVTILRKEV